MKGISLLLAAIAALAVVSSILDINRCHVAGGKIERAGAFHECVAKG